MMIGLSSAAFYGDLETEEAAASLREYPLDFAEIFLESYSEYNAPFGREVKKNLGPVPCRSIHAKGTQFEPDLFGSSRRQVKDAFTTMEGVLQAGKEMGAAFYVFHGPPVLFRELPPLAIAHLEERLPRLCALSKAYGVRFLWENVSWCTVTGPKEVAALRRAFPDLGFVLDIKQAVRAGEDPFAVMRAMGPALCHVHVMDMDGDGKLCLPGEGTFDFPRLARELAAIGYSGGILLEPYASQGRDPKALSQSLTYLKEAFA